MIASAALRIVSLQPSVSIILDHLGALDALVGCTKYCIEAVPALAERKLTVVKDSWSCTTEEILSARPTLVIACVPYRMESLAALLKVGCPVVTLAPRTLADIAEDIRLLGSIVLRTEQAGAMVQAMNSEMDAIRTAVADRSRPTVYCEEWGKPLIHSQPWVAELVEVAGGRFLGTPAAQTTPDAVAESDPDAMIFCWCGAGDRVPLDRVIEKRGWQHLKAAQNRQVYCIADEWLNSPAPSILRGLRAIALALHPDRFGTAFAPAEQPRRIAIQS